MQSVIIFLLTLAYIVLLKKTKWFFRVLPYALALLNMATLPLWPVLNFRMSIMITVATAVNIFVNVHFDGDSLAQHTLLAAAQMGFILYRTRSYIPFAADHDAGATFDVVFVLANTAIITLISSNKTSDFKEAFTQKFYIQK